MEVQASNSIYFGKSASKIDFKVGLNFHFLAVPDLEDTKTGPIRVAGQLRKHPKVPEPKVVD